MESNLFWSVGKIENLGEVMTCESECTNATSQLKHIYICEALVDFQRTDLSLLGASIPSAFSL